MEEQKLRFSVTDPVDPTPDLVEIMDRRRDYVSYGEDNLFPQYLMGLYLHSAVMESIVKGMKDYICGNGLIVSDTISDFSKKVNGDYETLEDIVEKAVFDYIMYDGFAIQVFRDEKDRIKEMYNLDFANLRLAQDGKYVYYSSDWAKYNTKSKKLSLFDREKPVRNSVFYFKSQMTPQSKTYPIPQYIGALSDIRTSTEISNFHLNSILNDFNASCIINLNCGSDVDEENKREVERKFKEKFAGTNNAGKFLLNFNDNKDTEMTVARLQSDDFDKRYNQLAKDVVKNIFIAFRAMPQLFGFVIEGSLFNNEEYEQNFRLYNRTVIRPYQRAIQRAFNTMFGLENSFIIKPFTMVDTKVEEKTETIEEVQ